jgi:hypothetical protein
VGKKRAPSTIKISFERTRAKTTTMNKTISKQKYKINRQVNDDKFSDRQFFSVRIPGIKRLV